MPVRSAARRPGKRERTLSAAHKRALAEGRTMSAIVNRYLAAASAPKRRGRPLSQASLTKRLADARERFRTATGVNKVVAAQEVRDLQIKLAQLRTPDAVDLKSLEDAFVKVAKKFGDRRGIRYGAWREAGVSAQVLKRAKITRTQG
jgi:hypothetical protein